MNSGKDQMPHTGGLIENELVAIEIVLKNEQLLVKIINSVIFATN